MLPYQAPRCYAADQPLPALILSAIRALDKYLGSRQEVVLLEVTRVKAKVKCLRLTSPIVDFP